MKDIEARIIIKNDEYDEEDANYIMDAYNELLKHIGWTDERRDKRYIVKFHDIFYYAPEEIQKDIIDNLFDLFCANMCEMVEEEMETAGVDENILLSRYPVGHYSSFKVNIDEITEDNAIELAMKIYDEADFHAAEYVRDYIETVDILKDLEDNYIEYWIDFLDGDDGIDKKYIEQIKERYAKDKERRQAK